MKVPTISTVAVIDMIISNNDNEELMRLILVEVYGNVFHYTQKLY